MKCSGFLFDDDPVVKDEPSEVIPPAPPVKK